MTFCLGMNLEEGLVGIADTRVISGKECITARKMSVYHPPGGILFVMTSGLRSVRDKTLTYFDDALAEGDEPLGRLYETVNLFARQMRRVAEEDKRHLEQGGLRFDCHALIGGQMAGDRAHKLYLVYPEGNWVDTGVGTPYQIIGSTGYGKPILDRTVTHHDPLRHALRVGCLAFDSTRISAADVDYPLDVCVYRRDSFRIAQHRYFKEDLSDISEWWQNRLREAVQEMPSSWLDSLFAKLDEEPCEVPSAGD